MGRTNSVLARNLLNTFTRLEFLKNLTDLLWFESFTFHNTLLKLSIIFLFSNSLFFREAYRWTICKPLNTRKKQKITSANKGLASGGANVPVRQFFVNLRFVAR